MILNGCYNHKAVQDIILATNVEVRAANVNGLDRNVMQVMEYKKDGMKTMIYVQTQEAYASMKSYHKMNQLVYIWFLRVSQLTLFLKDTIVILLIILRNESTTQ